MLSSAGTDTETMTCTSDDESEYSTANKMQQVRLNYQLFVYEKESFVIEFFLEFS